jgi:membrane protein YdbS with pleckstrin-like domain
VVDEREQIGDTDPVEEREAEEPASVPPQPAIVDGEEHSVDPRSVRVARIIGIPVILVIAMLPLTSITVGWAVGGIPTAVYLPLLGGLLLIAGVLLWSTFAWTAARHRHLRYRVDENGLRIRRGVFWRKVILIPASRVQHTDVSQGPVQRSFELATLTVHTAGTEGASISLAGLEHGIATHLCDHLQPDRETDAD